MAVLGKTTYTVDDLVIGDFVTDSTYPVKSGNSVVRGQVMELVAGKLVPCLTTKTPHSIMLENIDATAGDVYGSYMVSGMVLESKVVYNTGTAAEFREALRLANIITRSK